jgi:hypothetical protein
LISFLSFVVHAFRGSFASSAVSDAVSVQVEVDVVRRQFNKALIGKQFKKLQTPLVAMLEKLDNAKALALEAQLERDGCAHARTAVQFSCPASIVPPCFFLVKL